MPRALFAVLCLCCLATGKVTGPNKKHGGSQDEDPTLRLARAVAAAVVQELNRQQPQALPPPVPMLPMLPPQRLLFLAVFEFQPGSPAKRSHSDYRIP